MSYFVEDQNAATREKMAAEALIQQAHLWTAFPLISVLGQERT